MADRTHFGRIGDLATTWTMAQSAWPLAVGVLRGSLRDRRGLIPSLLTPLLILLAFRLGARHQPEILASLFAACIALSVVMAGSTHTTRLVSWREQGVLKRLACAPIPIALLLAAAGFAQVTLGVLQAIAIVLFGVLAIGLPLDPSHAALAVVGLALGATCFIAYGSLIAQIANRSEGANALFVFSVLPMFFLGGGVPQSMLPPNARILGALTPAGMITALMEPVVGLTEAGDTSLIAVLGLLGYTATFLVAAARIFRVA